MSPVELQLLERWTRGRDAEAFAQIVSRYSAMVYNTARRILGNRADAEDVTQDCFLRLAEAGGAVQTSLGGWLHTTATRRALDLIRGEMRRRARESSVEPPTSAPSDLLRAELHRQVDDAIARLPEELRVAIVEHFLLGRTHAEIADALGLSRPTITTRIHEGIERIRADLGCRGIIVAAAALGTMLVESASEAAPASLTAALGRLALSGASSTGASTGIGTVMLGAKLKLAAVVVAALAVGWYVAPKLKPSQPPPLAPIAQVDMRRSAPSAIGAATGSVADATGATALARNATAPGVPSAKGSTSARPATTASEAALANREMVASATRPYLPGATEAVLMGFVCDAETGAVLAGARLTDLGSLPRTLTTTNAQGIYRLYWRPSDQWTVRFRSEGYVIQDLNVELPAGQEVRRDIRLEPGRGVDVYVIDDASQPVPGAHVEIQHDRVNDDRWMDGPRDYAAADRNGFLHLAGLSRKRSTFLFAHKDGYESSGNQEFRVGAYATGTVEYIRLKRLSVGVFAGGVVDPDGRPAEGIKVVWWTGNSHTSVTTDKDGRYRLTGPRSYMEDGGCLYLDAKIWAPSWRGKIQPGTEDNPQVVNFTLDPGHWMSGIVVDEGGAPLSGAFVSFRAEDRSMDPNWYVYVRTDHQGRFRVDRLPEPEVRVTCSYPKLNDETAARSVDCEHRIVLQSLGVLAGRVEDERTGAPVVEFRVSVSGGGMTVRRSEAWEKFDSADGIFLIKELGRDVNLRVVVAAEGYFPTTLDDTEEIHAQPAESAHPITVKLKVKEPLAGRVVDADTGAPLADARLLYVVGETTAIAENWPDFTRYDTPLWGQLPVRYARSLADKRGQFSIEESDRPGTLCLLAQGYCPKMVRPDERAQYQDKDGQYIVPLQHGAVLVGQCFYQGERPKNLFISAVRTSPIHEAHFHGVELDDENRFRLEGLPPGAYVLSFNHPFFYGKTVTLREREEKIVTMGDDLGPCTLTVRLLDREGRPLPKQLVRVIPNFEWEYCKFMTFIDDGGILRMGGLKEGPYRVSCSVGDVKLEEVLEVSGNVQRDLVMAAPAGKAGE